MIDLTKIRQGMDVMASDGQRLGAVREIVGQIMFLDDALQSAGQGEASIPLSWVLSVDEVVHLAKSREQVELEWQAGVQSTL